MSPPPTQYVGSLTHYKDVIAQVPFCVSSLDNLPHCIEHDQSTYAALHNEVLRASSD